MAPSNLSSEWLTYASTHAIPPKPTTIPEAREAKSKRGLETQAFLAQPSFALLANAVTVTNTEIELPEVPGHPFPLRLYKPTSPSISDNLPIMLYFHGGYWCTGDANSEDLGCRSIVARGQNIIIASFSYRLAPEHSWKEVFADVEYAMKWLWKNAKTLGGDVKKGFLVGGAEAGAHLAAICAISARNRYPEIRVTGQVLIVPTTIAWPDEDAIPEEWKARLHSHAENKEAPLLDEELYEFYVAILGVPDEEKRKGENFPVWGPLEGLPPAYLPMDECDPIGDQGLLYAELLAQAGVKTRTDYYRGLPNMFVQFPDLPTTLFAGVHLSAGVQWLLQERK